MSHGALSARHELIMASGTFGSNFLMMGKERIQLAHRAERGGCVDP